MAHTACVTLSGAFGVLIVLSLFITAVVVPKQRPYSIGGSGKFAVRLNETRQIDRHTRVQQVGNMTVTYIAHIVDDENATEQMPVSQQCCTFIGDRLHWQKRDMAYRIYNSPSSAFTNFFIEGGQKHTQASAGISILGMVTQVDDVYNKDVATAAATQGMNTVSYGPIEWEGSSGTVLGVTMLWVDGPHLWSWAVIVNSELSSIGDAAHSSDKYDLPSIINHELGHVYGIADEYDPVCGFTLMYGVLSKGETSGRNVDSNCAQCLQALYQGQPLDEEDTYFDSAPHDSAPHMSLVLFAISFGAVFGLP